MIGGLNSSLSLATRTASEARTRMDRAAREIATGQKVASVKDDGAAWARAAGLKSQKAQNEGRTAVTSLLRATSLEQDAQNMASMEASRWIQDVLIRASAHAPGTQARTQLQNEFQQAIAAFDGIRFEPSGITSGYMIVPGLGWGIPATGADPELAGEGVFTVLGQSFGTFAGWLDYDFLANGQTIRSMNLATASQTAVNNALAQARYVTDVHTVHHQQQVGRDQVWLDQVDARTTKSNDRLDRAISSLTDADMGKASANLRKSEARQQLALSTVRQALDAYGSYANGLLGNVQRTQRSIMA
jgi:flagellin-like hook-associated protein FlgL